MKHFFTLLFCFCYLTMFAQQRTISGTVTDAQNNEALIGVNILIVGTSTGAVTEVDGSYTISVPGDITQLQFSYAGYETQTINIGNQTQIDVTMASGEVLEEVVIVGYGVRKVTNLSGSVETINGSEIARQPVVQTSQALAGLSPGLVATQTSGQPGNDGAAIRIRGIGTLGNGNKNNPLILVDGIPDNINAVDPNDIESISVLKDASAAAIYGSRAANGVIIITTKRGKTGTTNVTYDSYLGVNRLTQTPDYLDGLGFMQFFNQGIPGSFTEQEIADYQANRGSDEFPDTDWVDEVFSGDGFQQYHRLGVNGGTEKVRVAASVAFTDQNGTVENFNFKRYNGRFNTDIKLSEKFNINFDLNFRRDDQTAPSASLNNITRQAFRIPPLFTAVNSDGTWGPGWNGNNPIAAINAGGDDNRITNYFRGLIKVNYELMENLILSATYSPQNTEVNRKRFIGQYEWIDYTDGSTGIEPGQNSLLQSYGETFQNNFNFIANYNKDLAGGHSLSGLLGYENLKNTSSSFNAFRRNFVLGQGFPELANGDADTQENNGSSTLWGLESVFGRVNYTFKDRYIVEANLRRDASSRFAEGYRADWFPSFSVGWNISEESFFNPNSAISFLKLRASWGQLGNQSIFNSSGNPVNFNYVALFELGENPIIGGIPVTGGAQRVQSNPFVRWESTATSNIAVDAKFLDNRLSFTGEYYIRTTDDILLQSNVGLAPSTGLAPPVLNVGSVENRGWDVAIDWLDTKPSGFQYGVNFNISDFVNEVTFLGDGIDQLPPGNTVVRVGEAINSIFGLRKEGLFQSEEEIAAAPTQSFGAYEPGDIRYADINNDGVVNDDDRTVIGNQLPRLNYGLDLFFGYKGFDLNMSWLGVGQRDVVLGGDVAYAFNNAGKIQSWQTDAWTPENPDAAYPRLLPATNSPNWRTSEQWLFDASYLRLRNLTLGYNFSDRFVKQIKLQGLKVFVSGQNLLTFDNMPEGIDPVIPNGTFGAFFPVAATYTFGVNVRL